MFGVFSSRPLRSQRPPGTIGPGGVAPPAAAPGGHPSLSALKPLRRPSLKDTMLSLVVAPMVVFIAASVSFAVFWQTNGLPVVLTAVALLVALPVAMPHADLKAHLAVGDVLIPVSMCLLAAVVGVVNGVGAYEYYMAPFYAMSLGRSYDNVLASSPGVAYYDAGKLRFAATSTVQPGMALGFRQSPRYCVAPVLDSGDAQLRKVSFWAIGMDCCGPRGTFTCGQVKGSARGGMRAVPDGLFVQSRREFIKAAQQAAAIADLAVDDDPILVNWVNDPTAEMWKKFGAGLGSLGLGSLLFLTACGFATLVELVRYARSHKDTTTQPMMQP